MKEIAEVCWCNWWAICSDGYCWVLVASRRYLYQDQPWSRDKTIWGSAYSGFGAWSMQVPPTLSYVNLRTHLHLVLGRDMEP